MIAYKLFRVRRNGTLGSLFIRKRDIIPIGRRLRAYRNFTPGFAPRLGWHACPTPYAPHLTERGRCWYKVELEGVKKETRPMSQGGTWYMAKYMTVIEPANREYVSG